MRNMENAQRRREDAEKKGKLSISHWRGELHSHTKTDISEPESPDEIIEYRKGSNCGHIPLEALIHYHAREMRNDFLSITDHAREGSPEKAMKGITDWFTGMYLNNEEWLRKNFSKGKDDLSESDMEKIRNLAEEKAEKVSGYGDERIQEALNDIDNVPKDHDMKVFKGIEVSLLPDGSLDTEMVEEGKFEAVNCSIHPNIDKKGFERIISDPDKYSDLVLKGISNNRVNIMCHIGRYTDSGVTEKLRWEDIAEASIKNKVAIEINLKDLISFLYGEILDYEKYPKNDKSYQNILRSGLGNLIPLLGSSVIRERLKPYFSRGLKIAINTDEHMNKFIRSNTDKSGTKFDFQARDIRFWRSMKIIENYFNGIFGDLGIKKENIINTFSVDELKRFFEK